MDTTALLSAGIKVVLLQDDCTKSVLTTDALEFVANLSRRFAPRVKELLQARKDAQAKFDEGALPHFLSETQSVRDGDWKIAPLPRDLLDRRVEITGPVSRKMVINALNSGAKVFMADFEDSTSPTWSNVVMGHANIQDAVNKTISHIDPSTERKYELDESTATLVVRPRGWHLVEKHFEVDGVCVPASLFDFGMFMFLNAHTLIAQGSGPYFYLPKLQGHLEARLWNDVFLYTQAAMGITPGTIKATVLIETLPAAFEMDEILYELREHSAGLNCGRWDYIFSFIKTLNSHASHVLPDRATVSMTQPFMRAYTQLVVKTCHRRGAPAIGGMAAQIPIKHDANANDAAIESVRIDKIREVMDGHDGTWVAHPGLVAVARNVFVTYMPEPNQIDHQRDDVEVSKHDLVAAPKGCRTIVGLKHNIHVGIEYLASWLCGKGCVPINNLMEDAATAEICRTQIWQWIRYNAMLVDGRAVTRELVIELIDVELNDVLASVGQDRFESGKYEQASQLFIETATSDGLVEFLTLPAYGLLD